MAATATNPEPRAVETADGTGILDRVLSATEAAMVRPEFIQMRIENETLLAECRVRPRDMGAVRHGLAELLRQFPDFADDAIYEKPVGRNDKGQMTFARGLSIRAAECLAEAYGWCKVRAEVIPVDADSVKVEATFTDYQSGRIWSDGGIISKVYRSKSGSMSRHAEDRFYSLVVKAETSRRIRECILRCVNPALKAWFESECNKTFAAKLGPDKITAIVTSFSAHGVTQEMLEKLVGKPASMGWTQDDRRHIAGVWNALKDGESTVAEIFGGEVSTSPTDDVKAKLGGKPAGDTKAARQGALPMGA